MFILGSANIFPATPGVVAPWPLRPRTTPAKFVALFVKLNPGRKYPLLKVRFVFVPMLTVIEFDTLANATDEADAFELIQTVLKLAHKYDGFVRLLGILIVLLIFVM